MLITEEPVKEWNNITHVTPAHLGFTYYFIKSQELQKWSSIAGKINVEKETIKGTMKFVRTFEELCEGQNLDRLGVLRMDVDNLGKFFKEALPAKAATLERYKSLSHKFDYFFSDYLYDIQNAVAPNTSLIIYGGGDDLFIVGAWDYIINFAKLIRERFKDFTQNNLHFSISGGVTIVKDTFPIIKAAEESALEEHLAKEHKIVTSDGRILEKNSISFMGRPMNWDTEFPAVENLKNKLLGLLNTELLNKSFIGKVIMHAANADIQDHKVNNVKTYWMLTYDLKRMIQRKGKTDVRLLIDTCIKEVCNNTQTLNGQRIETNYHPLELWSLACRWTELEYRTRS